MSCEWNRIFDFNIAPGFTIDWYHANNQGIRRVRSGEYRKWIKKNYGSR